MNKSTDYLGQPILSQFLSLVDKSTIEQTIRSHDINAPAIISPLQE